MSKTETPWWIVPGIAALSLMIFAGAVIASCFVGDTTLRTTMMTGALQLGMLAAGFYFGSSSSSQKKDDTIAAGQAALATSAPAVPVVTTTKTETDVGATTTTTAPAEPVPAPKTVEPERPTTAP